MLPCASASDLGFTAHPVILQVSILTIQNLRNVSSGARTVSSGESAQYLSSER